MSKWQIGVATLGFRIAKSYIICKKKTNEKNNSTIQLMELFQMFSFQSTILNVGLLSDGVRAAESSDVDVGAG